MPVISIKSIADLKTVAPKAAALYKDVPLTSLTAYSLYWLDAWELRPTIEAVSVLNWRLFPNEFSMVGFSDFPDALRTNRSLLQGQPKYRNLLTGTPSQGYSLNQHGVQLAESLTLKFGPPSSAEGVALGGTHDIRAASRSPARPRTIDPQREIERARNSRLFSKWRSGQLSSRDVIHVHSLLGIFDHTPARERVKASKALVDSAETVGDAELIEFLRAVREMFPSVFASRQK